MKIVVIGGTGLIGSKLVAQLAAQGHDAVPASPKSGVNSVTGEGLGAALDGADVVVDVSNAPDWSPAAVLDFFERSSRNLVAAGKAAGIKHHVALSIVGTDRMADLAYFHAKVAQEQVIKTSGLPYTIVRATQFFEFVRSIADAGAVDGKVVVPAALFQPIAADDVAAALADVAVRAPLNATIDIAGPDKQPFASFVSRRLRAAGDGREVVADPKAGYFGAVIDDQSLTPLGQARLGAIDFDSWLASAA
ncbi:SDR family oxidoreductase [Bradyrhizobium sp. 83012]|uniref:SDR family oxidoreductase n=1 Tax=Bradyrhizobium aeschynomenes TaxID=2734909 RepID=A0ABX2CIA0_9BRAD|nr:SDR family oxidoreductase [Bradyrhizobium aeschynomenes]NPU67044.1 SDR family oxidoreductase [Bradyrhizobium aeschynomenes]